MGAVAAGPSIVAGRSSGRKIKMSEKPKEKIIVGADHNGLPLKNVLRDYLRQKGYEVDDGV